MVVIDGFAPGQPQSSFSSTTLMIDCVKGVRCNEDVESRKNHLSSTSTATPPRQHEAQSLVNGSAARQPTRGAARSKPVSRVDSSLFALPEVLVDAARICSTGAANGGGASLTHTYTHRQR